MKLQHDLCVFVFVLKYTGMCWMFPFRGNLPDEQTVPCARPLPQFQKENNLSPIIVIQQETKDNRLDTIIRCISDEGLSVILNFDDFSQSIPSMMQASGLSTSKLGFNFLIFSDVDGLYTILNKAHQIDRNFGQGSQLRHFSKWLVVLTNGKVNSLILEDVLFDNVAVTTLQAMGINMTLEKMPSQLYTLMWKNSSRQLQEVSLSTTEPTLTRVFPNTKHGLNGRLLKAAVLPWETCVKKSVNGTFTYTGLCDYILSYLSRKMNFSYTYIEPKDQSWGVQYDNGTWNGIIGMLVDGTADLSPVPYALNYQRYPYVTNLQQISRTSAKIVYKKTNTYVNWTVLLTCFQWRIYVYGVVVLMWVTALFVIFKKVSARIPTRRHQNTFLGTIDTICGVPLKQGSPTLPATDSQRILLGSWWLFCIVITSVYCGNLVAYLSVAKEDIPFTGLDDLLDSGYDVGASTGTYIKESLTGPNISLNKEIWQKIKEHQPSNMTPNEDDDYHTHRLIHGGYALITTTDRIRRYTAIGCDFAGTNNGFFQRFSSFILPKHSPLAGLFDPEIMSLVERGLPDYWMDISSPEQKKCAPSKQRIFKVESLLLVLVVSGIGVIIATVILVLEKCGVCHCY